VLARHAGTAAGLGVHTPAGGTPELLTRADTADAEARSLELTSIEGPPVSDAALEAAWDALLDSTAAALRPVVESGARLERMGRNGLRLHVGDDVGTTAPASMPVELTRAPDGRGAALSTRSGQFTFHYNAATGAWREAHIGTDLQGLLTRDVLATHTGTPVF
jgi:hypothetical protein